MTISPQGVLLIAVQASGVGLALLAVASLAIPRVLRWSEELKAVSALTRQVFWTYSIYTWATNCWMALMSLLLPGELLRPGPLSVTVSAFIAVYWIGRIVVQFSYYDRSNAKASLMLRLAELALVALFSFLSVTFAAVTLHNLRWI